MNLTDIAGLQPPRPTLTVACVLTSKRAPRCRGQYDAVSVQALRAGVRRYLLTRHRFVCLSDEDVPGVETIPLEHGWPGWWSKLELFRPGLFGPGERVLYLDLDTLPVGNLYQIASYTGAFAMLSDFSHLDRAQSGVMAWTPGEIGDDLWRAWTVNPAGAMGRFRGDGEWIRDHVPPDIDRLQDLYPRQIVSLKYHASKGPPPRARLVCAHGNPKFDNPKAGWAHRVWSERLAAAGDPA